MLSGVLVFEKFSLYEEGEDGFNQNLLHQVH